MNLNRHSPALTAGKHAFLSPSSNAWVNYDDEQLARVFFSSEAAKRGTEFHDLAQRLITMGVKLPDVPKTLNMYVNDAIGFRMTPEQQLIYSEYCFGTTDAICFNGEILRIHDLKMGAKEATFVQLLIYAAIFCLEYNQLPKFIQIELAIYQNDQIRQMTADPSEVLQIMEKIKYFDKRLKYLAEEAAG